MNDNPFKERSMVPINAVSFEEIRKKVMAEKLKRQKNEFVQTSQQNSSVDDIADFIEL